MTFGSEIRRLRKQADISQQALAEAVGYERAAISKIERDERRPAAEKLQALVEALKIDQTHLAMLVLLLGEEA